MSRATGSGQQPRVVSGRQSELLGLLRDEGSMSRVALGERLELPRAKLTAELGRLVDVGLVQVGGPAASRGGRRSTLVHLAGDLRVLGVDVGATSVTVAVTDGRCERSEEHTSELQSRQYLVCRLLLEKKKYP